VLTERTVSQDVFSFFSFSFFLATPWHQHLGAGGQRRIDKRWDLQRTEREIQMMWQR